MLWKEEFTWNLLESLNHRSRVEQTLRNQALNHSLPLPDQIRRPNLSPPGWSSPLRGIRIITAPPIRSAFTFHAYGHPRVSATHSTTLEITADDSLTSRGDCIVAVRATCGLRDLPPKLKEALSNENTRAMLTIRAQGQSFQVIGRGSRALTFEHPREMVLRKSGFVSDRTLLVNSDKAARDIPRGLIRILQKPEEKVAIEIRVMG